MIRLATAPASPRVRAPRILHDDGELVPAQATHRVDRPRTAGEPAADLLQQRVADAVTQAVVHRLEVVEIDEQEGETLRRTGAAFQRMRQAIHEETAIGKSRQRVVIGMLFQLLSRRRELGDVFGDAQDEFRRAVSIPQ